MVKQLKTNAELRETITGAQGKLVIIDFFATWCGPCNTIAPFFDELAEKYKNVIFVKIDVDDTAMEEAVQKYGVNSMPTFVFLKNDKEVDRQEGGNKGKLEKKVAEHSA